MQELQIALINLLAIGY